MSLAGGDLTTLTAVQGYIDSAPSNTVLSGLIIRVSRMMLSAMSRPLLVPRAYTEQFNGTGSRQIVLPNWPLLAAPTLAIGGVPVTVAPQPSDSVAGSAWPSWGFRYQPWNGMPPGDPAVLELTGGAFYRWGQQNVVISYNAGYQVSGEVPNAAAYTPLTPWGSWATDRGVTYAGAGAALTAITSGAPGVGQYVAPAPDAPSSPTTAYTFNAADVSTGLLISYGFIPADVEQAAIEFISERASYRRRVGVRSQSLAGQEVMSYDLSAINKFVQATLGPYCSVIPPAMGASV
jgi:hypothetical protein